MTTFATETRDVAAPSGAAGLDVGAQKALSDFSPSRLAARSLVEGYPVSNTNGGTYLEIARHSGTNLIAHAVAFPETSFTAASTKTSIQSEALREKLRIENVAAGHLDLAAFESTGLGTYDFVAAADVFSTSATAERMALLVLAKKHLSENGVACIGVDVSPGWDLIDDLRNRLCSDLDRTADAGEQVGTVRSRIINLAKNLSTENSVEQRQLRIELVRLGRASDVEIYRDLLDPDHHSMPMNAFLAMADAAKLKPIGDIEPAKSNLSLIPPAQRPDDTSALSVAEKFDLIDEHAQTRRRHVLLVHAERKKAEFDLNGAFNSLCFTSQLIRGDRSLSDPALLTSGPVTFVGPLKYRTENPIEIVALALMERHKYFPVRGDRLVDHVVAALRQTEIQSADSAVVSKTLLAIVGKLLPTGAITAHMSENRAVSWLSERPVAAPLALVQARRGDTHVTSLLPHSIVVDETARFILSRLDGIQTLAQISEELADAVSKGELTLIASAGTPAARVKATLMRVLGHAARSGLLVS